MARKVKGRSKTKSAIPAEHLTILREVQAELLSLEQDFRTSTVTFCRRRLKAVNQRLTALLGEPEAS